MALWQWIVMSVFVSILAIELGRRTIRAARDYRNSPPLDIRLWR